MLAERQMGGFLGMAALVGVGAGLGAAALITIVRWLQELVLPLAIDEGRAWIFLTVPTGFLIAWLLAKRLAPEVAGDGVPQAVAALEVQGGRMRPRVIPLKILATAVTIGGGGSAGREGPIVQIGAAIGSAVSKRFNLGEDQIRSLVAAGAGAGIGATFNAPIAGMLFALEVILFSFAARHVSAIVIASVAAAVTTQSLVGAELAIRGGVYELGDARELLLYAGLAIVIVAIGVVFLRLLGGLDRLIGPRTASLGLLRPLVAGLLVAGLVFVEPGVFGTGQAVTNRLLAGEVSGVWWVLMLLALAKVAATALTLSSGASGGAFMPSLFTGAAVGTGFALLVEPIWGISTLNTGAFAVVGMAAMFSVVGRGPLTAILLVFEVTGAREYQLILPLMLTATLATFLAERFHPESVYSMGLRTMGISVRRTGEVDVLDTIDVGAVMAHPVLVVGPKDDLGDLERRLHEHQSHGAPVVENGRLVGIITISDVARARDVDKGGMVSEAMTSRLATVTPTTRVSRALERMAVLGVGRLPVVAEDNPDLLVGMFRREDAVRAYHDALTTTTDVELHRARLAQRTSAGAGYYDFRVPPRSIADGRAIREVSWPEGSTLVSIRRERSVMIPSGDTVLLNGDLITAFGTPTSKERMIDRLNAGAEEVTEVLRGDAEVAESGAGSENPVGDG